VRLPNFIEYEGIHNGIGQSNGRLPARSGCWIGSEAGIVLRDVTLRQHGADLSDDPAVFALRRVSDTGRS